MQLDIVDEEDDGIIDKIQQILKHRSWNARYTLHKHFEKFDSIEDAKENKLNFENLTQDNWETLCTYLNDPIVKVDSCHSRVIRNKQNLYSIFLLLP